MQSEINNTLRLGIRELHALLDKIDELQKKSPDLEREFVRWNFRIVRANLTIEHATGAKVHLPVATRNISRGGISVLHSSFVYPGSKCHILAELEDDTKLDVTGVVLRCEHIGGKVHEIGIKFDREISTKDLLGLDPINESYSLESIDPAGLIGNLLLVCDAELDQQLLINLLDQSNLQISIAKDSEGALARAKKGVDLVLSSYSIGEETASDILMSLRSEGIDAPVIVMTSDDSEDIRSEMRMVGASGLIIKPFSKKRLLQALAEFLLSDGDSGPMYSTVDPEDTINEILMKFLAELPRMILTLERSLREADTESCRAICGSLACGAMPLGFESIGTLAAQADRALSGDTGIRNAAADIRQLIIACRRIKTRPIAA